MSEEQAERLISAMKSIGSTLGWIGIWLFLILLGGCNGWFSLGK